MADLLEKALRDIVVYQKKHALFVLILVLLITGFLFMGITKISIQSDLDKGFPQDLPIFKINDEVADRFGGQDAVVVLVELDRNSNFKDTPIDIRDPKVINFLVELEKNLQKESVIKDTQSVGTIFKQTGVPETLGDVKSILDNVPNSNTLFNKDYRITLLVVYPEIGSSEENIEELNRIILDNIELSSKPAGVKTSITGIPILRVMLSKLLIHDAIYTLILAAIIIFILLVIMQRSFTKAIVIFLPLSIGIIWTIGTMGWVSVPISLSTAGLGVMILGLGVEYGIFIVTRYKEERKNKDQLEALQISISKIGSSIMGSGLTTIVGFLALTLSSIPMLRDLGITLALGIAFSLAIAIFVMPSFIVLEEVFEGKIINRRHKKSLEKMEEYNSKNGKNNR